jgi:VanZ family protein
VQLVIRLAFWFAVLMLILLTIVPPSIRPTSGVASHHVEHFASFALTGMLYYLSYAHHLFTRLAAAILFAGGLEVLQLFVPGRHARLVDFVMDALGACTGIVFGFAVVQTFGSIWTCDRWAGGRERRD